MVILAIACGLTLSGGWRWRWWWQRAIFFLCSVAASPSQGAVMMGFATALLLLVLHGPPAFFIALYLLFEALLLGKRVS